MKQAVLISIKPEWCRLIASGKKTIELRKTKPRLKPPFKCYIYQTLPKWGDWNDQDGHVIGEFICDDIIEDEHGEYADWFAKQGCVPLDEQKKYAPNGSIYGWLITRVKIYDAPKKVSDFKRWNRTEENAPCAHVKWLFPPCESCKDCNLKRPPQSWCYVEELK